MDERNSYRVGFLGASALSQIATGLGCLQKPLRDMYIPHRKPGNPTILPERYLSVTPEGLTIAYYDDQLQNSRLTQEYHPLNSIILWDAVRFITVRGTEKKDKKQVRCAFEPLDNDHSRVKENLFSAIDKKFHYVHEQNHPPMFTCVIRRKSGVKALDAHVFVCVNDSEALGMVHALNQVQNDLCTNQTHETGVFGYQPFAKGTVRVPSGAPIVKIAASPSQQQKPPATSVDMRISHQQYSSDNNRTVSQSDNYYTNRSNDSGSSSSTDRRFGSQSRIFNLSQEDLLGPALSVASPSSSSRPVVNEEYSFRGEEEEYDDGYQYIPHIARSLDRGGKQPNTRDFESDLLSRRAGGVLNDLDRNDGGHSSSRLENAPQQSKYSRNTTANIATKGGSSQYSENQPFNYVLGKGKSSSLSPKKVSNQNERPPPLPAPNPNMGQGYSLLSGPNEHPRRHWSESSQDLHHQQSSSNSSPYQQASRRDVISSVSENPQVSEETNRKIFRELLQYQKQQQGDELGGGAAERKGQRPPQLRPPKSPGYLDRPPGAPASSRSSISQDESPEDNTGKQTGPSFIV